MAAHKIIATIRKISFCFTSCIQASGHSNVKTALHKIDSLLIEKDVLAFLNNNFLDTKVDGFGDYWKNESTPLLHNH
jgi:hypothetical protein